MAVIDIGPNAIDRASEEGGGYTNVYLDNPANDSGKITKVEIWARNALSGCKVGTFYGTAPNFTCRDFAIIGDVPAGSKQTFDELDIEVEAGDYIGAYWVGGDIESDVAGGAGVYYKQYDQFETGEQGYALAAGYVDSFYGEGGTFVLNEKEITEGIAVGEVVIKNPMKLVVEGVALSEVLVKAITKAPFVEGIALGEVVESIKIKVKEIIEGLEIGEVLFKQTHKVITEGIVIGEVITKAVSRVYAEGIAVGEVLIKRLDKVFTEGIAIGEAVSKLSSKIFTEGIAIGEVLIKMRVLRAIRSLRPVRVLDAIRNLRSEREL